MLLYVDWFNKRRTHNTIGKIPPAELEEQCYIENIKGEMATTHTIESL